MLKVACPHILNLVLSIYSGKVTEAKCRLIYKSLEQNNTFRQKSELINFATRFENSHAWSNEEKLNLALFNI